jgi:hypothetical protein
MSAVSIASIGVDFGVGAGAGWAVCAATVGGEPAVTTTTTTHSKVIHPVFRVKARRSRLNTAVAF